MGEGCEGQYCWESCGRGGVRQRPATTRGLQRNLVVWNVWPLMLKDRIMKCLEVTRVVRLARQWNIISLSCTVDPCDEHGMLVARAGANFNVE